MKSTNFVAIVQLLIIQLNLSLVINTSALSYFPSVIRLTLLSMARITRREGYDELLKFDIKTRNKIWKKKSKQYFKFSASCSNRELPCMVPYIFCDSTPSLTTYERRQTLHKRLMEETPPKKRHIVILNDLPLHTDTNQSCFIGSMTPKISRRLASKRCESKEKNCIIHPLLPMMKLAFGTVDAVTEMVANNAVPYSTIVMAELSPYHKRRKELISLDALVETILDEGDEDQHLKCEAQFEDTLPNKVSMLTCDHILKDAEVVTQWISDSIAAFYISPDQSQPLQSPEFQQEKIFRFISGLAVSPKFVSIGLINDYYEYE